MLLIFIKADLARLRILLRLNELLFDYHVTFLINSLEWCRSELVIWFRTNNTDLALWDTLRLNWQLKTKLF